MSFFVYLEATEDDRDASLYLYSCYVFIKAFPTTSTNKTTFPIIPLNKIRGVKGKLSQISFSSLNITIY